MSCCGPTGLHNFTCNQGATFSRTITWKNSANAAYDLTGYTARMHVRETVDSANTIITLTTANSRITLGSNAATKGQITLTISAADTANLTPAIYVYDLEVVSGGGVVDRLIEGNFVVKAEVTR
jgi:hypothetical protein